MILPERTVDIWAGCAIERLAPGAQLWAPTTNAQGLGEPDLYVRGLSKVLLFEHKGIGSACEIVIPFRQFADLLKLEIVLGNAVYYGLPDPGALTNQNTHALLPGNHQARFENQVQVYLPSELLKRIVSKTIQRRPVRRGSIGPPYWKLDPAFFAGQTYRLPSLLRDAQACVAGLQIADRADLASAIGQFEEAFDAVPDTDHVRRWLRQRDLAEIPEGLLDLISTGGRTIWRRPCLAVVPLLGTAATPPSTSRSLSPA